MKHTLLQWWVIGTCPLEFEAHRSVFLARAWAQDDEVRYVHPMELTTLVRSKYGKGNIQRPPDFGRWMQNKQHLYHTSRLGFSLPSLSRRWRMPGYWWTNKWPFGCWLMPGTWWISERLFGLWLRREMIRCRQTGVPQIIVNFCWKLSWGIETASADALIYDCADNHRAYPREIPMRIDWAEGRLARLCDAVVVSSFSFGPRMQCYNPAVTHIPNGVSQELLDSLAPSALSTTIRPRDKPVIIYHGVTFPWRFNWDLYLAVARLCPEYEFRIYTNAEQIPTHTNIPANVRVMEWLSQRELSSVLSQCSLGFMAYEPKEPTLSGFPLKMFEYLAAGLPIVSTRLREVERFADYVTLCDNDPQGTAALIRREINNNTGELRATRRALAEKYSWQTLARQYRDFVLARLYLKKKRQESSGDNQ